MLFNTVSDHSELSRKPLNHLLAGKNDPKTLDPDTRLECQEESSDSSEESCIVQEETLKKVLETAKSTPERYMGILEETNSRPPKKVQEDLRKANQLFQTESLQQHQGTNMSTCLMNLGHLNFFNLYFYCSVTA